MSDYVREKVLRIPLERLNLVFTEDEMDDLSWSIEKRFHDIFDYAEAGKFRLAPTYSQFVDYVLEHEYGADGEYGKTRALTDREKEKYRPFFQKINPDVDMAFVRLVEFCWYNCCEAPDYYDETKDSFYDEV